MHLLSAAAPSSYRIWPLERARITSLSHRRTRVLQHSPMHRAEPGSTPGERETDLLRSWWAGQGSAFLAGDAQGEQYSCTVESRRSSMSGF